MIRAARSQLPRFFVALAVAALPGSAGAHDDPPDPEPPSAATISDQPCVNGLSAGGWPCSNIDLLAFVSVADFSTGSANDIWGWTDPQTGTEYALVGVADGMAIFDIGTPTAPVYVGKLPTHTSNSSWRDIRVHANHALVVSEASGHGMQVLDLTQLAGVTSPPVTFTETAHYAGFGDAHNVVVNEVSARAYAVGSNTCSGGLHILDVSTPTAPAFLGCFSADGYTHDAQCVTYQGPDAGHLGSEICFASNTDALTIVDASNGAAPVQLSTTSYLGVGYTHQGWLTEDHHYFLLDDESDELDNGHNTRTLVWDVSDLGAPVLVGAHDSTTAAIDHNQFVVDDHSFQANYRAGVRILRLGNLALAELGEVAFFDTVAPDDLPGFSGVWGVYPFFASGNLIASDINNGLFVLHPHLDDVPRCDDGLDNDADGLTDAGADPGCRTASSHIENPECDDGADNDGDQDIDLDDTLCRAGWDDNEASNPSPGGGGCGLGFEVGPALLILARLARRRRRRAAQGG